MTLQEAAEITHPHVEGILREALEKRVTALEARLDELTRSVPTIDGRMPKQPEQEVEDFYILEAMGKYGGNFVHYLAIAARYANDDNLSRIKRAWPEYWTKYAPIALKMKKEKT